MFVPHEKVYNMMGYYINRRIRNFIKKRRVGREVYLSVNEDGIRKLKYWDEKLGLPPVLREPIEMLLE